MGWFWYGLICWYGSIYWNSVRIGLFGRATPRRGSTNGTCQSKRHVPIQTARCPFKTTPIIHTVISPYIWHPPQYKRQPIQTLPTNPTIYHFMRTATTRPNFICHQSIRTHPIKTWLFYINVMQLIQWPNPSPITWPTNVAFSDQLQLRSRARFAAAWSGKQNYYSYSVI